MPRHLLQHLAALLGVAAMGGCVDEPAPTSQPTKVVLPDLSPPAMHPRPRPRAARRRAASLPGGLWRGHVDATWVTARLDTPALRIVDLRPAAQFARGHLPGAVSDPAGRKLLTAALARHRAAPPGHTTPLPTDAPARTVVLVHGGQDLSQRAVAARAYLLLYATGADVSRLAILRGGYANWRRQRHPRTTSGAPARPRPRPATPTMTPTTPTTAPVARPGARPAPATAPASAKPRPVLITDPARLAAARRKPLTQLVRVGPHVPASPAKRPAPGWIPFGLAPLELAPQPTLGVRAELRSQLGPLLSGREKTRLIASSKNGLWASLLWLTLKTRLGRPDRLNAVYLGPLPPR